jgi:hypothetical protein
METEKVESIKPKVEIEKLPKIKFSHCYNKLLIPGTMEPVQHATLLQVISVPLDHLSKEFLAYDTDNGKYALKYDSLYMMLIFKKPLGDLFTTLRTQFGPVGYRQKPENKLPYYQSLVGKVFEVVINPKD